MKSDQDWMQDAIDLAKKGLYTTDPNPRVGCVIVKNGVLVGRGYHAEAGQPHAEVFALREASEQAQDATCYVTLEPCCHTGRTPPCTQVLIQAQVKRVVIAMLDPNPLVAGKGVQQLEEAGIEVHVGICSEQALDINIGFVKRMSQKKPYIRIKLAASLDGKTALKNGESKWITNSTSRADVQHWRARSSAVLTGVNTVLLDNPQLNVRDKSLKAKQPVRVILDTKARLTSDFQIFTIPEPIILFSHDAYSGDFPEYVSCYTMPKHGSHLCLESVMKTLAELEINEVLVEAGQTLSGTLFEKGLYDEVILYQAPKVLGSDARNLLEMNPLKSMQEVTSLKRIDVTLFDDDVRMRFTHHDLPTNQVKNEETLNEVK